MSGVNKLKIHRGLKVPSSLSKPLVQWQQRQWRAKVNSGWRRQVDLGFPRSVIKKMKAQICRRVGSPTKPVCPACQAVLMPEADVEAHLRFECSKVNVSQSDSLWACHVHKFQQPLRSLTLKYEYQSATPITPPTSNNAALPVSVDSPITQALPSPADPPASQIPLPNFADTPAAQVPPPNSSDPPAVQAPPSFTDPHTTHAQLGPPTETPPTCIAQESQCEWCQDSSELAGRHEGVACPDEGEMVRPRVIVARDCVYYRIDPFTTLPSPLVLARLHDDQATPTEATPDQLEYGNGSHEMVCLHTAGLSHDGQVIDHMSTEPYGMTYPDMQSSSEPEPFLMFVERPDQDLFPEPAPMGI